MKDKIRIIAILIGVFILITEIAYSKVESVPSCDPEDSLVKQSPGFRIDLRDLPKVLLVARESVQEIIGRSSMIVSKQSFVRPQSKVTCAKYEKSDERSYSLIMPVLLDLTSGQKTKNSYWQFQTMAQKNKIGVWNQKTRIISQELSLDGWIKSQNVEVEFFQYNHEQIMMQIRKKEGGYILIQRVYYDISPQ